MRFPRNVNLHRLRNKFNFLVAGRTRREFFVLEVSRLQPPQSRIHHSASHSAEHVWRYLPKARLGIDDFDYNIWLKHQNKYDARRRVTDLGINGNLSDAFEKGEARCISRCSRSLLHSTRVDEMNSAWLSSRRNPTSPWDAAAPFRVLIVNI